MIILINKKNYTTKVYKEKKYLANELNISTRTLTRHLNKSGKYENNLYFVSVPEFIQGKSLRGGKRFNSGHNFG